MNAAFYAAFAIKSRFYLVMVPGNKEPKVSRRCLAKKNVDGQS